jgi:ubiquinone/menaquinone biosynthesis C-methylase UbiE
MAKDNISAGFRSVDQATDPASFVHYLETASAQDFIQTAKRRTFSLLEVKPGDHLLDVGCGLGDEVRVLAHLVGSTGRVVGVDNSETMIAEARKRADGTGLPVEYQVGDAQRLTFADNTFDGCRAERIFQHLNNPRQALAEMVRVARPGARIVILDPDRETRVIDVENRTVTRKILHFACDRSGNGWMGRQLAKLFKEAELAEVSTAADTFILSDYALTDQARELRHNAEAAQAAGIVTAAEAAEWLEQLERANRAGCFFAATIVFCVSGRKP